MTIIAAALYPCRSCREPTGSEAILCDSCGVYAHADIKCIMYIKRFVRNKVTISPTFGGKWVCIECIRESAGD